MKTTWLAAIGSFVLVVVLIFAVARPARGQSLGFEITFGQLISDVETIKSALGMGSGRSSRVIDSLDKRVHDLEFAKTLAKMSGNSEAMTDGKLDEMRRSTVDTRISTLESKNNDLLGRIKELEFGNELLQDRIKSLEDASAPGFRATRPRQH